VHGYSSSSIRNACIKLVIRNNVKASGLLDIGGSTGEYTQVVSGLVKATNIYLVDMREESLFQAKKSGLNALSLNVSTDKLPFPCEMFDMVMMIEVIEHLANPDNCIEECKRVLKKGGLLLLSTPNLAWWINRLVILLGYQPYYSEPSARINVGKFLKSAERFDTSGHIRLFTFKAILKFLEYYGFSVVDHIGAAGEHSSGALGIFDRIFSERTAFSADVGILAKLNDASRASNK